MSKQTDNAFTGNIDKGNPYKGDLERGISYDTYEANFNPIEQEGNFPVIRTPYRLGAKRLISHLPSNKYQNLMDAGSGTGISTLELCLHFPETSILGVEISEGMITTAKYKFHQDDGKGLLKKVNDPKLIEYWNSFRKESRDFRDNVGFIQGDIQEIDCIKPGSIDAAIANQVIHWTDISKSFGQFRKFLKTNGVLLWNTSSHFYNDSQFPSLEYSFRYNDFLRFVLEEVSKNFEVRDIENLAIPKHNLFSLGQLIFEQGFETEHIATYLIPIDFQIFIQNHVPASVRDLIIDKEIDKEDVDRITKEAISKVINNPNAFNDTKHKYDINPVFESRKL